MGILGKNSILTMALSIKQRPTGQKVKKITVLADMSNYQIHKLDLTALTKILHLFNELIIGV